MKKILSLLLSLMMLLAIAPVSGVAADNKYMVPTLIRYTDGTKNVPATDLYTFSYDSKNKSMRIQKAPGNQLEDDQDDSTRILGDILGEPYPFIFQNKDINIQNVETITHANYLFWGPVYTGEIKKIVDNTGESTYSAEKRITTFITGKNGLVSEAVTKNGKGTIRYKEKLQYDSNNRITKYENLEYEDGKYADTESYVFKYDSNGIMKSYNTKDTSEMCYTIKNGRCTLVRHSYNDFGDSYSYNNGQLVKFNGYNMDYQLSYDSNNNVTKILVHNPSAAEGEYNSYYSISYMEY